jgi:hypothetical protein
MSTLVSKNQHLSLHRRMIVARSIVAGAVGLVPVPFLDDWLAATVKRGTIRRIAEARRVDVDEGAVRAVAEGIVPPPSWKQLLGSTAVTAFMNRAMRRVMLVWGITKRAEDSRKSFAVATLFDHYCTRLHVGAAIDEAAGRRVRAAIDQAIRSEPPGISSRVFKKAIVGSGRAILRAPLKAVDGLTGGRLRKLLGRGETDEAEARAEEVVDEAIVEVTQEGGPLMRAVRSVEAELSHAGAGWLDELIVGFEAAYRAQVAAHINEPVTT